MKGENFLTVEQVATRLQVKSTTVREWIKKGELPAIKLGRVYRIHPEQLDKFIEAKNAIMIARQQKWSNATQN